VRSHIIIFKFRRKKKIWLKLLLLNIGERELREREKNRSSEWLLELKKKDLLS